MRAILIAASVAYGLGGFWTFGHLFNQRWCGEVVETNIDHGTTYTIRRGCAEPIGAGILWPIYWSGRAAIEVTR